MPAKSIVIAAKGISSGRICITGEIEGPVRLALDRLCRIAGNELACRLEVSPFREDSRSFQVAVILSVGNKMAQSFLKNVGVQPSADGTITVLAQHQYGDQGFLAGRGYWKNAEFLWLAANTSVGLKNAVLTLTDRLYRDENGNLVSDNFEGLHCPAFERRHLKTDAMNCGRFRSRLEYWDTTRESGINEFADWLASFRISDYGLITFMRGWGLTYANDLYPALTDPQHPNPPKDYYSRLIDRLGGWRIKTWATDIYIASGYSMEVGTCPQMLSPSANKSRLKPFRAGEGTLTDILCDPETIACLSHPAAARYYTDIVLDLIEHYPKLSGLDFHIGHTFPDKICRCPKCQGYLGNRRAIYRCFQRVYEAVAAHYPSLRMRAAVKIWGDATRDIVEHCHEFPQLEFFTWMRFVGNYILERTDAPVTTGHEDGGGGLEAWYLTPDAVLSAIRGYYRDYEPWIRIYLHMARTAGLKSISWEPALHRELEHMFFMYSQLSWEPDLSWSELARRYVLRYKRRMDDRLIQAYTLALEINASITAYGFIPKENAVCGRVVQTSGLLSVPEIREKTAAFNDVINSMGITKRPRIEAPVAFDLEWSLGKTLVRLLKGEVLGSSH